MILVAREVAENDTQEKGVLRDTVLLLASYAGAVRSSELPSPCIEDVEFVADGVTMLLRRSKAD